jgi:hypothetical protein
MKPLEQDRLIGWFVGVGVGDPAQIALHQGILSASCAKRALPKNGALPAAEASLMNAKTWATATELGSRFIFGEVSDFCRFDAANLTLP